MPVDIITDLRIELKANAPEKIASPQAFRVTDSMLTVKHGYGNNGKLTVALSSREGHYLTNAFNISSLVPIIVIAFEQKLPSATGGTLDTLYFDTIELTSTIELSGRFSVGTDYPAPLIAISGGHRIKKVGRQ